MIVEYIRYKINDDGNRLVEAYEKGRESLDASPHCLGYELSRCTEDAQFYVLRIEWDSLEGHLKGFRNSAEFKSFFQAVQPFVGNIEEMRHYEITEVKK